jgi:hypothetical protein
MTNRPTILPLLMLAPALALAACGASKSESGDAARSQDVGSGKDTSRKIPSFTPGALSGDSLGLVGTWKCSASGGSTSYVITQESFHQDWSGGSFSRMLEGTFAATSTERTEVVPGTFIDGFAVLRMTKNEGLIITSAGQYGRLSWQNVSATSKKLFLADSYASTLEDAAAILPTSYAIWDTCTRSSTPDASSDTFRTPDTNVSDSARTPDAGTDVAKIVDAPGVDGTPDGNKPDLRATDGADVGAASDATGG